MGIRHPALPHSDSEEIEAARPTELQANRSNWHWIKKEFRAVAQ
jgi:hypothetical protein